MNSHLVILLLALAIALISGKNVYSIDGPSSSNEEPREMITFNEDYNRLGRLEDLSKLLQNERNHPQEYDRYLAIARRAKAIVKGDPREFMG